MKTAFRLYSWSGFMKDRIDAVSVKSHSDARKLGPFVTENKLPLIWVNWSKPSDETGKKTKPYFRNYPQGRKINSKKYITIDEEISEKRTYSESDVHLLCRKKLQAHLNGLIKDKKPICWSFLDRAVSDFAISGDLLAEVEIVETNYKYKTYRGIEYEFDLALLGRKLNKERIILGVIEIERTHKFGFLKLLISKTLGFPLISINVEDLDPSEVDDNWCRKAISETTYNSNDSLRRNYFYIHNSLYPVYTNVPYEVRKDHKHQFIVFCKEEVFDKLFLQIKAYRGLLGLSDKDVVIQPVRVNLNEPSSLIALENEGSIAGSAWKKYNEEKYLRITLPVPREKHGNIYLFHLVLARLLNAHFDTLVGYKYCKGINNHLPENPIWTPYKGNTLIIQKSMSEPISDILEYLEEVGIVDRCIGRNS